MSHPFAKLELDGQVAVVTGSSGGIGQATCELLTSRGATVVGVDRSAGPWTNLLADVSNDEGIAAVGDHCSQLSHAPSILVNNAGIGAFEAGVHQAGTDVWDHVMAVNARSVYAVTRALFPQLETHERSVVINVSSVHALSTSSGVGAYAASKGAVLALTRSMAIDLATFGIRVMAVLPGAIDTPMLREHLTRTGKSASEMGFDFSPNAVGRVCSPEEVAETIAFLSSEAASAMTGSAVVVDAGLLAGF